MVSVEHEIKLREGAERAELSSIPYRTGFKQKQKIEDHVKLKRARIN